MFVWCWQCTGEFSTAHQLSPLLSQRDWVSACVQLISMISSRLSLSTFAHLPDLSFFWSSQRWVPHHHHRNQSHQVSTVQSLAHRSIWRQSKMTSTLPCNLKNLPSHKSPKVVIWLSHVVRSLQRRHRLSVDKQVGQLRHRQVVLGGLECVF